MSIWVKWSARDIYANEGLFIVKNHQTLLNDWADCRENGEAAAADCVELWVDLEKFEEEWGFDPENTRAQVVVTIHEPSSIAGDYDVGLNIEIKCRAVAKGNT